MAPRGVHHRSLEGGEIVVPGGPGAGPGGILRPGGYVPGFRGSTRAQTRRADSDQASLGTRGGAGEARGRARSRGLRPRRWVTQTRPTSRADARHRRETQNAEIPRRDVAVARAGGLRRGLPPDRRGSTRRDGRYSSRDARRRRGFPGARGVPPRRRDGDEEEDGGEHREGGGARRARRGLRRRETRGVHPGPGRVRRAVRRGGKAKRRGGRYRARDGSRRAGGCVGRREARRRRPGAGGTLAGRNPRRRRLRRRREEKEKRARVFVRAHGARIRRGCPRRRDAPRGRTRSRGVLARRRRRLGDSRRVEEKGNRRGVHHPEDGPRFRRGCPRRRATRRERTRTRGFLARGRARRGRRGIGREEGNRRVFPGYRQDPGSGRRGGRVRRRRARNPGSRRALARPDGRAREREHAARGVVRETAQTETAVRVRVRVRVRSRAGRVRNLGGAGARRRDDASRGSTILDGGFGAGRRGSPRAGGPRTGGASQDGGGVTPRRDASAGDASAPDQDEKGSVGG